MIYGWKYVSVAVFIIVVGVALFRRAQFVRRLFASIPCFSRTNEGNRQLTNVSRSQSDFIPEKRNLSETVYNNPIIINDVLVWPLISSRPEYLEKAATNKNTKKNLDIAVQVDGKSNKILNETRDIDELSSFKSDQSNEGLCSQSCGPLAYCDDNYSAENFENENISETFSTDNIPNNISSSKIELSLPLGSSEQLRIKNGSEIFIFDSEDYGAFNRVVHKLASDFDDFVLLSKFHEVREAFELRALPKSHLSHKKTSDAEDLCSSDNDDHLSSFKGKLSEGFICNVCKIKYSKYIPSLSEICRFNSTVRIAVEREIVRPILDDFVNAMYAKNFIEI